MFRKFRPYWNKSGLTIVLSRSSQTQEPTDTAGGEGSPDQDDGLSLFPGRAGHPLKLLLFSAPLEASVDVFPFVAVWQLLEQPDGQQLLLCTRQAGSEVSSSQQVEWVVSCINPFLVNLNQTLARQLHCFSMPKLMVLIIVLKHWLCWSSTKIIICSHNIWFYLILFSYKFQVMLLFKTYFFAEGGQVESAFYSK